MSFNLSRREAMKGMMAVGATVAAMPYLANLAGSVQARPTQATPAAQSAQATPNKVASPTAGFASEASSDAETLVLVIRSDVISGFKGLQQMKLRDGQMASVLRRSFVGRFE